MKRKKYLKAQIIFDICCLFGCFQLLVSTDLAKKPFLKTLSFTNATNFFKAGVKIKQMHEKNAVIKKAEPNRQALSSLL